MTEAIHPAAPHHLPSFITAPGETDVLMVVMAIVLVLLTLMVGILYIRLHALPERTSFQGFLSSSGTYSGTVGSTDRSR